MDLDYVDGYSVETTSLTPMLVAQAHYHGKEVYAWTANTEETIKKILRSGADGLIIDNPALAAYCAETLGKNLLAEDFAALFFPQA